MRVKRRYRLARLRLNAVRVNALAADGFIGEQGRRAVVALGPSAELTHPLLRIRLLQVRNGRRRSELIGELQKPILDAQAAGLRLRFKRGSRSGESSSVTVICEASLFFRA